MSRKKTRKDLFEAEREQRYLEATTQSKPCSEGSKGIEGRGRLPFVMQPDEEAASVTGRAGLPLVVEVFRG